MPALVREEVFITNAVLCNPKDEQGRNDRPTATEIGNCAEYQRETVDLIQPRYVVALGQKGLDVLHVIEPHGMTLKGHVASAVDWRGVKVVPLYHPSARAMVHRPFDQQVMDYQALKEILKADPEVDWTGRESP